MRRREFIEKTVVCTAYAVLRAGAPGVLWAGTSREVKMTKRDSLLRAMENAHMEAVKETLREELRTPDDALEIHAKIFPIAQRVLNPPFINPHLPKMYAICRELMPWLEKKDLPALIAIEVQEVARRPKLPELPPGRMKDYAVRFRDIQSAIEVRDPEKTALLMRAFQDQAGGVELARQMLLLGSGYLDSSLGHSVSCTAFILLEMLHRENQDPWPVIAALADYFCKGGYHERPPLKTSPGLEELDRYVLLATSGQGIVNLHHTITFYAIERVRHLLQEDDYHHMLRSWISFMGRKEVQSADIPSRNESGPPAYRDYWETFSQMDAGSVTGISKGMLASAVGRKKLARFLTRGVCDSYNGDYNPHYITGLGSILFIIKQYRDNPLITENALYQYLTFFFSGIAGSG